MGKLAKILVEAVVVTITVKIFYYLDWDKVIKNFKDKTNEVKNNVYQEAE